MSLGADLLSIYDDARRSLDDAVESCSSTDYVDGDYVVEMLPAEEHDVTSGNNVGSATSADRSSAAAAAQRAFSDVDERTCKRPLSVSSTSSSMSSTSSLPRHERKKLATAAVLQGVDDASRPGCPDGETAAGCLSTVVELVPAAAAISECPRARLCDGEGPSTSYDGGGADDDVSSATAHGGDDHDDDDDDDAVAGRHTRTLSRSQYVDRVVAEIVDTERAYVDDLDQIIHVCIHRSAMLNILHSC